MAKVGALFLRVINLSKELYRQAQGASIRSAYNAQRMLAVRITDQARGARSTKQVWMKKAKAIRAYSYTILQSSSK